MTRCSTSCLRQSCFLLLFLCLSQVASATIEVVATTLSSADGSCTGSISVRAEGTAGPFEIIAIGPVTSESITGVNGSSPVVLEDLCAGTYEVAVTNAYGCVNIITTVVGQCAVTTLVNGTAAIQHPSQCGASNGRINLTDANFTGGIPPYTYQWSTGATTAGIANLLSGTYTLTVTDGGGCPTTHQFTLLAPNEVRVNENITPTCSGTNNGSISIFVYTGQIPGGGGPPRGPYTFTWSNGIVQADVPGSNPTSRIEGLAPGNYTVTIRDQSNICQNITKTFTVPGSSADPLIINGTIENTCPAEAKGAIQLQISGGMAPYQIYWDGSSTPSSERLSNLLPGSHCARVVDRCGVIANQCFVVPLQQDLVFDVITTKFQHASTERPGAITLAPTKSGSYTYQWNTGSTSATLNNLTSATYYVTVTNTTTGCKIQKDYYVKSCAEVVSDFEIAAFGGSALDPSRDINFNLLLKPGPSYSFGTILPEGFTIEWSAPNGTVLGNGFALTLDKNTTYNKVIIKVSDGCTTKTIEKTILKCDTQDGQLLRDAFIANSTQPCVGDNQGGQITLSIPNIPGMAIVAKYKESTQSDAAFGTVPLQTQGEIAIAEIGGLSGIKDYNIKITVGTCIYNFSIKLGEKEPEREFIKNEKDVCFYRLTCNGEPYGDPNQLFQEIGSVNQVATLEAETDDHCRTVINCGNVEAVIYGNSKRVRTTVYEQILRNAVNQPPYFFSDAYLERAKGLFEGSEGNECMKVKYCPNNFKFIKLSPAFLYGGSTVRGIPQPLGNGCSRIICGQDLDGYKDYIFCDDESNPILSPDLINCKVQRVNIFSLHEGRNSLLTAFGNLYKDSELDNFVKTHGTDQRSRCASVTFCENNFKVIGNSLLTTFCGLPLQGCFPSATTCQLETDESGYWLSYCSGAAFTCKIIRVIPEDGGPGIQDIADAERRTKVVRDSYQSEKLVNFGISKEGMLVNPEGLALTENGMIQSDFHPLLSEVKKDTIPGVEHVIEDWEQDYLVYIQSITESKQSNLVIVDTNIVINKLISSDTFFKIHHLSTIGREIFVGGTFKGALTYDSTVIANSDSAACFLLRVATDGTLLDKHIIKNIDSSDQIAFSENQAGSIVLAAKHKGNLVVDSIALNLGATNGYGVLRIDSTGQVQLIRSLQGGENVHLLDVSYAADTLNPSIALAFHGADTLAANGTFVFADSSSHLNMVSISPNGTFNWRQSIQADRINLAKFDLTFGSGNDLFAGVTFRDTIEFMNHELRSKGGEDLALVKINPAGVSQWQRTYGTGENENVSRLLYNYGTLYFGGEFTGSVGDKTIGKYVFSNLVPANTKAYISYIPDQAPPSEQLVMLRSEKENQGISNLKVTTIDIFPNPFNNTFRVRVSGEAVGKIEVANALGQNLLQFDSGNLNDLEVSFNQSGGGLYLVKVYNPSGELIGTKKVVKLN